MLFKEGWGIWHDVWGKRVDIKEVPRPFRAPGYKLLVRIADEEEKELEALRDWWRAWDGGNRLDAEKSASTSHTGDPNYSGRWRRGGPNPNGHMGAIMYDCSTLEIRLYRCVGGAEAGTSVILRPNVTSSHASLNAVSNRASIDDAVKMLPNSLSGETQAVYFRICEMRTSFCETRRAPPHHGWVPQSATGMWAF